MEVQRQKEEADVELMRLTRERDVADTTYLALATKVEEQRIAASDALGDTRLASQAAVPTEPMSRSRILITVVATVVAAFFLIGAIILRMWWGQFLMGSKPSEAIEPSVTTAEA